MFTSPQADYRVQAAAKLTLLKMAAGSFPTRLVHDYAPLGDRRDAFTRKEQSALRSGTSQWLPKLLQNDQTSIPEMMASPGRQALLMGGLGGALGGAAGYGLGGDTGAAVGALGVGGLSALAKFVSQRKRNAHLTETMRRLPPGATKRDLDNEELIQSAFTDKYGSYSKQAEASSTVPFKVIAAVKGCYDDGGYGYVQYHPGNGGYAIFVGGDWWEQENYEPTLAKLRAAGVAKVKGEAEIGMPSDPGWFKIDSKGKVQPWCREKLDLTKTAGGWLKAIGSLAKPAVKAIGGLAKPAGNALGNALGSKPVVATLGGVVAGMIGHDAYKTNKHYGGMDEAVAPSAVPSAPKALPAAAASEYAHGTESSQEALAPAIAHYYSKVPGGFHAAVAAASKAPPAPGFGRPLDYERLNRPVTVHRRAPMIDGGTLGNRPAGVYRDPSTLDRFLGAREHVVVDPQQEPQERQLTKEHELTHAWTAGGTPSKRLGDVAAANAKVAPIEYHLRNTSDYLNYANTPVELDPRIAAFKRWAVRQSRQQITTDEEAQRALKETLLPDYHNNTDVGDFKRTYDGYQDQPEVQKALRARMLQLVQGNSNTKFSVDQFLKEAGGFGKLLGKGLSWGKGLFSKAAPAIAEAAPSMRAAAPAVEQGAARAAAGAAAHAVPNPAAAAAHAAPNPSAWTTASGYAGPASAAAPAAVAPAAAASGQSWLRPAIGNAGRRAGIGALGGQVTGYAGDRQDANDMASVLRAKGDEVGARQMENSYHWYNPFTQRRMQHSAIGAGLGAGSSMLQHGTSAMSGMAGQGGVRGALGRVAENTVAPFVGKGQMGRTLTSGAAAYLDPSWDANGKGYDDPTRIAAGLGAGWLGGRLAKGRPGTWAGPANLPAGVQGPLPQYGATGNALQRTLSGYTVGSMADQVSDKLGGPDMKLRAVGAGIGGASAIPGLANSGAGKYLNVAGEMPGMFRASSKLTGAPKAMQQAVVAAPWAVAGASMAATPILDTMARAKDTMNRADKMMAEVQPVIEFKKDMQDAQNLQTRLADPQQQAAALAELQQRSGDPKLGIGPDGKPDYAGVQAAVARESQVKLEAGVKEHMGIDVPAIKAQLASGMGDELANRLNFKGGFEGMKAEVTKLRELANTAGGGGAMGTIMGIANQLLGGLGLDVSKMSTPQKLIMILGGLGLLGGMVTGSKGMTLAGGAGLAATLIPHLMGSNLWGGKTPPAAPDSPQLPSQGPAAAPSAAQSAAPTANTADLSTPQAQAYLRQHGLSPSDFQAQIQPDGTEKLVPVTAAAKQVIQQSVPEPWSLLTGPKPAATTQPTE